MKMQEIGVYVILTKPSLSYEKILEVCIKYNIKLVQLREKDLNDKELLNIAKRLVKMTIGTNTKIVINDRVDIAYLSGSEYVHVGQDDIPVSDIKNFFKNLKIGKSNHSLKELKASLKEDVNYVAFGPIFHTDTKPTYSPVGLEKLKEALKIANKPLVAIGGINESNLKDILKIGVKNFCMVRYFMETIFFEDRLKKILDLIQNN